MGTSMSRIGLFLVVIAVSAGAATATAAPGTPPATTQPTMTQPVAAATAPASQPGVLLFEPMPGGGGGYGSDFQGMGNMKVPDKKPAFCKSDSPQVWHETTSRYKSALLFDESGGTGTGYDTLYVSFDGDETFAGEVAKYKPLRTDVTAEAPGRNFEMTFDKVNIMLGGNRPPALCKITFRGNRNQDDPESKFTFGGRLYPPQAVQRWAVGTLMINNKLVRVALIDENTNGKFTDRGGLNPQDPSSPKSGDSLLIAMTDDVQLNPRAYGNSYTKYAQRIPLPEYLVLDSGTFRVKVEQSETSVKVDLVPVQIPAGTVELTGQMPAEQFILTGTKTYVMLSDVPTKIFLPADTYSSPYSGESPYEVEAEEGLTVGLPYPKGQEILVPVLLPDGKPAAGADYLIVKPGTYVQITNGYIETRNGAKPKKLSQDGIVKVRTDLDTYGVIVIHNAGWAQLAKQDVEAKKEITLEAWGQVEGTVKIGTKPAAGQQAELIYRDMAVSQVDYRYTAIADEDGHFKVSRVLPRKFEAGRKVTYGNRGTGVTGVTYVKVEPGKTAKVAVGGTGRAIVGRIAIPAEVKARAAGGWTYGDLQIPPDKLPIPSYPQNWMGMTEQEQQDWWKQRRASLGKIVDTMKTPERPASFQLEADGSFRIDDVPAGNYILEVRIHEAPSGNRAEMLGWLHQNIEIPPMEGGRSDEALDLGTIPLPTIHKTALGDPAPQFEVKDVHGKPLRPAAYAGKYLVLGMGYPGGGPTWIVQFRALHEQARKSERAAFIAVYTGRAPENVAEFLEARQMDWPQAFVDYQDYPMAMRDYDVEYPCTFFLIDPQGRIVAREKDSEAIKTALTKALAGQLKAPTTGPAGKAVATQAAGVAEPQGGG